MRMILVALLVPLLVLSSAGRPSDTIVTSCEACHEQAVCHTSPMAGDITCTCKKGFSGDGLICLPGHTATADHHHALAVSAAPTPPPTPTLPMSGSAAASTSAPTGRTASRSPASSSAPTPVRSTRS
ncbi:uromodulin-like [Oncorhynchus keta]|uniref:uromodulin-like n=1 Tax=Oncorhynchus keta TaxID=8018 RepID=UPI00227A8925|nr:uromodulin-like [Oncorhynchus keta]